MNLEQKKETMVVNISLPLDLPHSTRFTFNQLIRILADTNKELLKLKKEIKILRFNQTLI